MICNIVCSFSVVQAALFSKGEVNYSHNMVVYRLYLGPYQELVVSDKFYEAIHQDIMAREGRPPVYSCGEGSDASQAACVFLAVRLTPVPRCERLQNFRAHSLPLRLSCRSGVCWNKA